MGKNRLAAIDHRLIGDLEQRGTAAERACATTAALLGQLLRLTPGEAAARVKAAQLAGPRQALTGEALAPVFPVVAAAQADGAISPAHARVITHIVFKLPAAVRAEHGAQVEQLLVTHAAQFDPAVLAGLGRHVRAVLDPDGTLDEEHDRARKRDFTMRIRPDGSSTVKGELDAACTEALATVLDTLSRPNPATTDSTTADAATSNADAADGTSNADGTSDATPSDATTDGTGDGSPDTHIPDPRAADPRTADPRTADPRTPGQRRHDGLLDAMLRLLRRGDLPDRGGVAVTILLTMSDEQLRTHTGLVTTGHGARISVEQALRMATDARLVPIVFGTCKQVTAYSTGHRIFTPTQRLAMTARDRGCSFRAATSRRPGAKPTTSPTTPSPDAPPSRTAPCCADITTANTRGWAGPAR